MFLSFSPAISKEKGKLTFELNLILSSNFLSLLAIIYIIFVPWKKGPAWYLKVSPYIYFTFLLINYILLPVFNLTVFLYFTISPKYDLK